MTVMPVFVQGVRGGPALLAAAAVRSIAERGGFIAERTAPWDPTMQLLRLRPAVLQQQPPMR